ncbi:hypothetical protein JCM8208_004952 [Rhodotorula glutinis]
MAQPGRVIPAADAPAAPAAPVGRVVPKMSAAVDAGFDVRVVIDLELDVTDPAFRARVGLDKVPLRGRWNVVVEPKAQSIHFEISHGLTVESGLGTATCVEMELEWEDAGTFRHVHEAASPVGPAPRLQPGTRKLCKGYILDLTPERIAAVQQESNGSFDPAKQRKYRLTVEIRQDRRRPPEGARALAVRAPDSAAKALPHDVRLFFPGEDDRPDAELWTSEHLLTTSSTYFRNLFSSGFAETVMIGVKRARTRSSTVEQIIASRRFSYKALADKQHLEDSDCETDGLTFQGELGQAPSAPHDPLEDGELSYRQITIEQTAYTTYRAVLLYLSTGYIQFAPLASATATAADPEARTASLRQIHKVNPSLPVPASPKSVYRLAHILELKQLESMALRFFRDEALTVSTAPVELFSELAHDHAEWRTVILDWIMERWEEIEGSKEWTAMMQRVEDGEVDGAGSTVVEVLRRVGKRTIAKP